MVAISLNRRCMFLFWTIYFDILDGFSFRASALDLIKINVISGRRRTRRHVIEDDDCICRMQRAVESNGGCNGGKNICAERRLLERVFQFSQKRGNLLRRVSRVGNRCHPATLAGWHSGLRQAHVICVSWHWPMSMSQIHRRIGTILRRSRELMRVAGSPIRIVNGGCSHGESRDRVDHCPIIKTPGRVAASITAGSVW